MTEKQAIKIRSIFCNKIPQEQLYTRMTDELANEFDIAIEKQIPIKPKVLKVHDISNYKYGDCQCGEHIIDDDKYCSNCGQKIDWSDTE